MSTVEPKVKYLGFTETEWEYVLAFRDAPREWWGEMARMIRAQTAPGVEHDEPRVTGHDTVWLMAHEG